MEEIDYDPNEIIYDDRPFKSFTIILIGNFDASGKLRTCMEIRCEKNHDVANRYSAEVCVAKTYERKLVVAEALSTKNLANRVKKAIDTID